MQRQTLESFLIHEVVAIPVGVLIRRFNLREIRFSELFTRLEGLVEDGSGQQIPHLDPHERLPAACRRSRDFDVEAVIRGALEFEEHLPFNSDRFNEGSHGYPRLGEIEVRGQPP